MKLAEVRKLAIRQQARVRFHLRNGMECVVTEHGVAEVPGFRAIPDFNLEEELAAASEFSLEPVVVAGQKNAPAPRPVRREQLAAMVSAAPTAAAAAEHEDD